MTETAHTLLPCPFCGGDAHYEPDGEWQYYEAWTVECVGCGARIYGDTDMRVSGAIAKDEALNAWNTRSDSHRQSAEREGAWRPIETAPRGTHVLINCRRWGVTEAILGDGGWQGATFNGSLIKCVPTHWQPLPTPPEAA